MPIQFVPPTLSPHTPGEDAAVAVAVVRGSIDINGYQYKLEGFFGFNGRWTMHNKKKEEKEMQKQMNRSFPAKHPGISMSPNSGLDRMTTIQHFYLFTIHETMRRLCGVVYI